MWIRVGGIAVLGLLVGCSSGLRIRPVAAPQVLLSKDQRAATIEGHGVRLRANGSAWKSNPWELPRYVTPMEIALENHSGRTLRIQYEHFELVGKSRSIALSPHALSRIATLGADTPHRSSFAQGATSTPRSDWDWGTALPTSSGPRLLTQDVMSLSVSEGVLVNGGLLTGFLYFENLAAHERQATFEVRLVDASTGEAFGSLAIPFQMRGK